MELSDNEDDGLLSSDSDYNGSSFEGLENDEVVVPDYATDSEDEKPKRRRIGSRRGRRKVQENEEQSDEEMAVEVEVDNVVLDEEVVAEVEIRTNKKKKKMKKKTTPTLMWEVWEEETEKWLDQHMTADTDLDNLNEVVAETVEPSPDLIMPLLRYQKEWLAWGLKQEECASKGGILADEMGMGHKKCSNGDGGKKYCTESYIKNVTAAAAAID